MRCGAIALAINIPSRIVSHCLALSRIALPPDLKKPFGRVATVSKHQEVACGGGRGNGHLDALGRKCRVRRGDADHGGGNKVAGREKGLAFLLQGPPQERSHTDGGSYFT